MGAIYSEEVIQRHTVMDELLSKAAWEEKMGIIIGICDNEDEWRNIILECIMEYASSCQQKIEYRMYASAEEYLQAERHADIIFLYHRKDLVAVKC